MIPINIRGVFFLEKPQTFELRKGKEARNFTFPQPQSCRLLFHGLLTADFDYDAQR